MGGCGSAMGNGNGCWESRWVRRIASAAAKVAGERGVVGRRSFPSCPSPPPAAPPVERRPCPTEEEDGRGAAASATNEEEEDEGEGGGWVVGMAGGGRVGGRPPPAGVSFGTEDADASEAATSDST